ncbi:carbohydrate ABC transporter membrane protein 1 (CUT1 family) [Streptomyces sp. 846.5]|nr:sugar ABC transporter permease [Streptomyces sp. 846.5]TDU03468.1 carbohydrate ABC transporter membrane protein 1 (CUT1 family) [Streptomyces sp. 846.5]
MSSPTAEAVASSRPGAAAPGPHGDGPAHPVRAGAKRAPRDRIYRAFSTPAILVYTFGFLAPSVYGVVISFSKWAGPGSDRSWIGFHNYVRILHDDAVRQAFINTLLIVLVGGAGVFGLAFLAMAVLRDMRGRAFVRAALYLPSIISMIAVGTSIGFLLNPDGVVNKLLRVLGLHALQQPWLDPDHIFACILVGVVWMTSGFYIVLLMTAVDAIPKHLYEEAQLAGLTRLQQFRYITFPLSRDMIAIAAVLWTSNSLRTFDIVIGFVGSAGTPPLQSRTYAVQQWISAGNGTGGIPELGYGSAMATLLTLLTIVLVVLVRRLGRGDRLEIS